MKRNEEVFLKIERYLADELSAEELLDFEAQMIKSLELRQEVKLHKALHNEMKDVDVLKFRKKIARIGAEQKKRTSNRVGFLLKIAASLVVLVGLSTYFWLQSNSLDAELFEAYYSPYPIEDVVRGDTEKEWDAILKSYSNKNYKAVTPQLKELVAKYPENEVLKLYLGNCYLNTNQDEKAIRLFKSISKESNYYEDARWYLALTYTKLNYHQKASEDLEWVIEYNGLHGKKATALLNQLSIENSNHRE